MKISSLIIMFYLSLLTVKGQNETNLLHFNYFSNQGASVQNHDFETLNNVKVSTRIYDFGLNYGHLIGKKGFQAFYSLDFLHYRQDLDLTDIHQDSVLRTIPENYYHIPTFSQVMLAGGLNKSLSKKWQAFGQFSLNLTDDISRSKLANNLTWLTMLYLQKTPHKQFSYGFGAFFNQLENSLLAIPILSLSFQNGKRGLNVLFPQQVKFWQRFGKTNYLDFKASFNSYSLEYNAQNITEGTDIYSFKTGLAYHYIWQNSLKFSFGVALPADYFIVTTPDDILYYSQRNSLQFHFGVSLVLID